MIEVVRAFLWSCWEWDLEQLRNCWLYLPWPIPLTRFLALMVVKWTVLLLPVWIGPVALVRWWRASSGRGARGRQPDLLA